MADNTFPARAWLILVSGALIVFIALGQRHSFGLFLDPVTTELRGIGRESYGFAIALQNLVWGLGQPFAGWLADRFGAARVIALGGLLYAAGLLVAARSTGEIQLFVGLGIMVGLGLSATTFAVVLGAVGRFFGPERRSTALGIATTGGSFGTFCAVPITLGLIQAHGWSDAMLGLGLLGLCRAAGRVVSVKRDRGRLFIEVDQLGVSLGWFVFWCRDLDPMGAAAMWTRDSRSTMGWADSGIRARRASRSPAAYSTLRMDGSARTLLSRAATTVFWRPPAWEYTHRQLPRAARSG